MLANRHLPVADPLFTNDFFVVSLSPDVNCFGFGFGNELPDDCGAFFTHGDVGSDNGEDNLSGDVGVPKLDGSDNLDSEEMKEFVFIHMLDLSSGSGVQRTVGKVICRELLLCVFCSVSGESDILF